MNNQFTKSVINLISGDTPAKGKKMYLTHRDYATERGITKRRNWVLRWDLKMKGHHAPLL